jgi:shikimate kinase
MEQIQRGEGPGIILLTGPKHSGKTTVGRVLAGILGGDFIDLDVQVEKQTGKSPRTLFREGPGVFRNAEALALAELLAAPRASGGAFLTIAAGGGLIDNPEAMEALSKTGNLTMVYLDVSPETAWERIAGQGELPPFLGTADPRRSHYELHTRRAKAYREKSRVTIKADHKSPEEIGREIAGFMNR